jgi:hypothetical protein
MVRRIWRKIHSPAPIESNWAARPILQDEKPDKFRGIFAVFQARATAISFMVAEGEKLTKNGSLAPYVLSLGRRTLLQSRFCRSRDMAW